MVGERRVVTILFCDVKDSTDAAGRLDPEDWTEIMNGAFEYMIRAVYKYEGTIARLLGDAVLAFFGAPLAHEDDPQRAVLAGLDIVSSIDPYCEQMQRRWGIGFNVRVGINTGLVVVGAVGSDLRVEYTALGDAINLAARMEQTSTPGTVQIAHETYKLVKSQFDVEELGRIDVKGKSEPVPAYRVLRRKPFAGRARGIEGLHVEMVGRGAELQALHGVMADLQQGIGQIVCVLGEAGIGKSRLVSEVSADFKDSKGSQSEWYEIASLSYETNAAYRLFQRLMQRTDGIAPDDPPQVVREKLAALIRRLPEERRPRATQVFEALFGLESASAELPLEGEAFKRELFEATGEWWRVRFADQSSVLVFDDMHWADAASVELLRYLLPLTEEMPLVLICVLRTERQAPAWHIKTTADEQFHHRYTEVMLHPLSAAESNELLNRLLANAELPDRLRASVLEKSGGNPFFIEEVVRALIDSGALVAEERTVDGESRRYWRATTEGGADFEIPNNLQSLLATRVDRLEESTRSTLQVASVIGRSFYRRVLQAVDEDGQDLDKHLGTLIRVDMIREAARVPEVEYAFRNPLTQEAVYKTILLKRRREFHRRVGEAIEALYPDRLEGLYGLLVHHFARAGQRDKAITFSRLAAQQALSLYAYDEAAQNLRAALELVEPGDRGETRLTLLEELADVYRLLRDGGHAIAHYQEALDLWRGLAGADRVIGLRLHRKIVQVVNELKWTVGLDFLQQANESRLASRASLEEDLDLMGAGPPHPETVRALVVLSTDAWRMQNPPDWEAAQRFAQAAVDMAEKLDSPVDLSQALGALANVLEGRSLLREHLQVAQRRLSICRGPQCNDVRESMEAIRGIGAALMYVGEYEQALTNLQEAESLATRAQAVDQQVTALGLQSQCWLRLDRWDDVLATEEKWRALEQRYPRERIGETCFFVALSASVYALRGDLDRANAYLKESYDYMVAVSGPPEQWQRNQFY
jgi:class 3 adenylate cyclase/tetratricopeptide (TPR) repeat protein